MIILPIKMILTTSEGLFGSRRIYRVARTCHARRQLFGLAPLEGPLVYCFVLTSFLITF